MNGTSWDLLSDGGLAIEPIANGTSDPANQKFDPADPYFVNAGKGE
jgi:hypothetical protein